MFCNMLHCVVVCCNVLQCVAVCCSVDPTISSVSQPQHLFLSYLFFKILSSKKIYVHIFTHTPIPCCFFNCNDVVLNFFGLFAKCALRCVVVFMYCGLLQCVAVSCSVLQCVAVCCSVLQRVAVCCSVSQCVAVCCSGE